MRRKFFFFLDRLHITYKERMALGLLAVLLVVLGGLNLVVEQKLNYDEKYYEDLERIFGERSRQAEAERNEILARYKPEAENQAKTISEVAAEITRTDTVRSDTAGVQDQTRKLININTAGSDRLQELPGIGPAYAERIMEWRNINGSFTAIDQLLEIRGIGEKRLEVIRPLISFDEEEHD